MDPDDRRDALIEVFVRLATARAAKPTTSEIAQEAGVAEGTIFRVFPTKEVLGERGRPGSVLPGPGAAAHRRHRPEGSLRRPLVDFTRIMQTTLTEVFGLMAPSA